MANNDYKKVPDARSDPRSIPEGVASIPPNSHTLASMSNNENKKVPDARSDSGSMSGVAPIPPITHTLANNDYKKVPDARPDHRSIPEGVASIPPSTFYGTQSQRPPPLPNRPAAPALGSASTGHYTIRESEKSPFREPELVPDDSDQHALATYQADQGARPFEYNTPPPGEGSWGNIQEDPWPSQSGQFYGSTSSDPFAQPESWVANAPPPTWGTFEDSWNTGSARRSVPIDGRNDVEEMRWWDPQVREANARPGQGILPPVLAEWFHNSEHTLFSVTVTPPDLKPPPPPPALPPPTGGPPPTCGLPPSRLNPPPPGGSGAHLGGSKPPPPSGPHPSSLGSPHPTRSESPKRHRSTDSGSSLHSGGSSSSPAHTSIHAPSSTTCTPTAEDVHTAVPHPNAYYCRKHNGWVLFLWKSSSVIPPLARSFKGTLPDQNRRRSTNSCVSDGEQTMGPANVTHHFHAYERAVDARRLTHPFNASKWEHEERSKLRHRKLTLSGSDLATATTQLAQAVDEVEREDNEGDLLDLYVCCQCSFYVVASNVIPGVIPVKLLEDLVKNKVENPPPDKSGELAALITLEMILTIIENRVWKAESRPLPVTRRTFQTKLGWNDTLSRIFACLGFETTQMSEPGLETALAPPHIDTSTPAGRLARNKLLRAWVELEAWVADYSKRFAPAFRNHTNPHKLWVKIDSAREEYQRAIGAHPDQIARGQLPQILSEDPKIDECLMHLGLTKSTYSPELLAFAYFAQIRCNPAQTVEFFSSFYTVCQMITALTDEPAQMLQSFVINERDRGKFTREDFQEAPSTLGFGPHGTLGVDYDDEVPDEFVENAWREAVRRAWRDGVSARDGQWLTQANDAFRRIAEVRGSEALWRKWEQAKDGGMTPERAYATLEVPSEIEDSMLITVFSMRVEDQPNQVDRMREAVSFIADMRDSNRLRKFLETGSDPGETVPATRQDWPRGLNQLGNTCYLNSLLQYFYTIKDLRDAVAHLLNSSRKAVDEDKLTDDDLKRHRVGGRLVTRKEILRSKKFVSELAELFWHLEHADIASVTPTMELAKLALVTSKDEEDDNEQTATDSSNDTDATLVEDAPGPRAAGSRTTATASPVGSPGASSSSVLGKRARDKEANDVGSRMSIDSVTDKDNFVIISDAGPSGVSAGADVEMKDAEAPAQSGAKPPPLPPRKTAESVMMFGRQHDVSECMDNCVFQIETALLKFDGMDESEDGKSSVVKRLFYGTLRQRLIAPPTPQGARANSTHDSENVFSILPVSVSDEGRDLYDGLSNYFHSTAQLDSNTLSMEITLVDLPPVLQIQLQRVQWDRETGQSWKSQAYVKFGETICMDRFLDSANPDKRARSKTLLSKLSKCHDRIHLLESGQHAPFTSALGNTRYILEGLGLQETMLLPELDDELLSGLRAERDYVNDELNDLWREVASTKQAVEDIWQDEQEAVYELTSVFIHRGATPQWGHYFFYSRHLPENPDSWFKYNDSEVSVVSKEEVLNADIKDATANPYMLVFVRKGSDMISTVKRCDPMTLDDA